MKRLAFVGLLSVLLAGCSSRTVSNTARTAVEQLLLSRAVDISLERFDLPEAAGKSVHVDFSNLKAYDGEYIKVAVRARFAEIGAILVGSAEGADYVAEVASGCLGMETKNTLVGIPSLPVPNSPLPLPEASVYRTVEQTAIMKLFIFVHSEGRFIASGRYYGKADRDESFVLWHRFQRADDIRSGWESEEIRLGLMPDLAAQDDSSGD